MCNALEDSSGYGFIGKYEQDSSGSYNMGICEHHDCVLFCRPRIFIVYYIYNHIAFIYNFLYVHQVKIDWYCILQIELCIYLSYLEDQRNLKIYNKKY